MGLNLTASPVPLQEDTFPWADSIEPEVKAYFRDILHRALQESPNVKIDTDFLHHLLSKHVESIINRSYSIMTQYRDNTWPNTAEDTIEFWRAVQIFKLVRVCNQCRIAPAILLMSSMIGDESMEQPLGEHYRDHQDDVLDAQMYTESFPKLASARRDKGWQGVEQLVAEEVERQTKEPQPQ